MLDIEDLTAERQTRVSDHSIPIRKFKTNSEIESDAQNDKNDNKGFLPGKGSVYVKTWGCGHNNSDGEYMAGLLHAQGYNIILDSQKSHEADVWLLNSCTVKGPSEQTFVNDIQKAQAAGHKLVVAGCVPQGAPSNSEWNSLSIIGVQQIDQVVSVVEETLKGNTVQMLKESKEIIDGQKRKTGGASLDLPKIRRNPYIEIIPINTGCLNQCTYCKTKHARGDLGSYYPQEIIDRVISVLHQGVKEIWLTSEDTGAYGKDIGVTIVDLLNGITKAMDQHPIQDAMLRIGMTNPPYILEHLESIAVILKHPKVYSFLHVPIQAGSTKVLEDMRRLYIREDFEKVADVLLDRVPGMTLATDIICGFPTESEEDFDQTMTILEKYRFSVLHISQFYPRPGTPAAKMKRIATQIVKDRSRRATTFFESYSSYSSYMDTIQQILVTEDSTDGNYYIGHNKQFHQILVPKIPSLMGKMVQVRITETGKFFMKAQVLPESLELVSQPTIYQQRIPKLIHKWRSPPPITPSPSSPSSPETKASIHLPSLLGVFVIVLVILNTLLPSTRWSIQMALAIMTTVFIEPTIKSMIPQ